MTRPLSLLSLSFLPLFMPRSFPQTGSTYPSVFCPRFRAKSCVVQTRNLLLSFSLGSKTAYFSVPRYAKGWYREGGRQREIGRRRRRGTAKKASLNSTFPHIWKSTSYAAIRSGEEEGLCKKSKRSNFFIFSLLPSPFPRFAHLLFWQLHDSAKICSQLATCTRRR